MPNETNTPGDITIKRLQPSPHNLHALAKLVSTCYGTAQNWTNGSKLVSGERATPSYLIQESQSHEIYAAYSGETLIGCIKTGKVDDTVVGKLPYSAGYIGLLAVDARYQSNGVGTRLVQFAERRCAELGVSVIVLDVLSPRVDIIEWYTRMGYTPTGSSVDARSIIEDHGRKLLTPARFLLLEKRL